ncbi:hypothetical protein WJX72_005009 [[Myrmecia] bisecta]|uniref:Amidohydrolase-related domain-containing protein n=1 Tax=[Myrmecia] bisecta TaxID=41462 RepID=A0AAW1R7A8_9CHLO
MGNCIGKWLPGQFGERPCPHAPPELLVTKASQPSRLTITCSPGHLIEVPRAGIPRSVPKGTLLLQNIKTLATFNKDLGEIKDAAIYVERNVIQWVGRTADLPPKYQDADLVLCGKDRIVIPGLVNSHHHMWQCLTRTVGTDEALFGWQEACFPAWCGLHAHDLYTGCKLAMAELILTGCTTSTDLLYIYPNDCKFEDSVRAARDIGMRFHPTRGAVSMGQSKGGLPPDELVEDEDDILADMKRVVEAFHDNSKYSMLRVGIAPNTPYTVTPELMVSAAKLARSYEGVRMHTHIAENKESVDFCLKKFGCRPGEYLKRVGWDKDDVWIAHCCQINDEEVKMWGENGIGTAHCACSNMRLADGICPVRKLLNAGANVGLGVDGSASNDSGNMLGEAREAMFLARSAGDPKGLSCREALELGIKGGARNLGRLDVGEIAPGFAADFVAWNTDTLAWAGAHHDEVAALVLCPPGYVDLSVINGEVIVLDGELQTTDLPALIKEHNICSARLCALLPKDKPAAQQRAPPVDGCLPSGSHRGCGH